MKISLKFSTGSMLVCVFEHGQTLRRDKLPLAPQRSVTSDPTLFWDGLTPEGWGDAGSTFIRGTQQRHRWDLSEFWSPNHSHCMPPRVQSAACVLSIRAAHRPVSRTARSAVNLTCFCGSGPIAVWTALIRFCPERSWYPIAGWIGSEMREAAFLGGFGSLCAFPDRTSHSWEPLLRTS